MIKRTKGTLKIALIGCGKWGTNLLRVFSSIESCCVDTIVDLNPSRLKEIQRKFKRINAAADIRDVLERDDIKVVVIATPEQTHYRIVKEALKNKKHVFVEKPLAFSIGEAKELLNLANKYNLILMTGYIYLFNNAIRRIKDYIEEGYLGKIKKISFTRAKLNTENNKINGVWRFMPHDVSILLYWLKDLSCTVEINTRFPGQSEGYYLKLSFLPNMVVDIRLDYGQRNKKYEIVITGSKKTLIFEDLNNKTPVRIYDGNKWAYPKIISSEPLWCECKHFLRCIKNNDLVFINPDEELKITETLQTINNLFKNEVKQAV